MSRGERCSRCLIASFTAIGVDASMKKLKLHTDVLKDRLESVITHRENQLEE